MATDRTVGVVGLGNMGGRMARVLMEAYPVVVFDIDPAKVEELDAVGATAAASGREVGERADVVVVSVPADAALEAAILGDDGVLDGLSAGDVLVDTSTVSPMTSERVAEACAVVDVGFLDAPVSGGARNAETGDLTVLVGGEAGILEGARDVLETIGQTIHHVGPNGAGVSLKVINNYMFGLNQLAVAEGLLMARAAGIPDQTFADTVADSSGGSYALNRNMDRFYLTGRTDSEFTLALMRKDVALAEAFAVDYDVPLLTGGASALYRVAEGTGLADLDCSGILALYERAFDPTAGD